MKEFLYGASIQGIQNFIFQTNKLKETIGASELVEQICTSEFEKFLQKKGINYLQDQVIIQAAGNIKYLFNSEDDCKKIVREFPRYIANLAPGITISQAVVPTTGDLSKDIDHLEQKLKTQRNRGTMPVDTGFMGLERARRTGGVAIEIDSDNDFICSSLAAKKKYLNQSKVFQKISGKSDTPAAHIPFDIEEITKSGGKSWMAVMHADGNALGILLQTLGTKLKEGGKTEEDKKNAFATFSRQLDIATKAAAVHAFKEVIESEENRVDLNKYRYPIRPVLLGGDDITIIIRADLALDFTEAFLRQFEEETKNHFGFLATEYGVQGFENGITACAGIAYIKESYPFHYGVHLAEMLTQRAKDFSKEDRFRSPDSPVQIPPSSLSFYKVYSSFVESMDDLITKTLTAPVSGMRFDYGPYLIHETPGNVAPTVAVLKQKLRILEKEVKEEKTKGTSKLRQWISELYKDKATADFMLERMKTVNTELFDHLELEKEKNSPKTIIFDLIQLHTLKF